MPTLTVTFTPDEAKAILVEWLAKKHPDKKFDVVFNMTCLLGGYGEMNRAELVSVMAMEKE